MVTEDNSKTKPIQCECCQFPTKDLKAYGNTRYTFSSSDGPSHKWLCRLCASGMLGTYYEYPEQLDKDVYQMWQSVCFIGNMILAEIRKGKS